MDLLHHLYLMSKMWEFHLTYLDHLLMSLPLIAVKWLQLKFVNEHVQLLLLNQSYASNFVTDFDC